MGHHERGDLMGDINLSKREVPASCPPLTSLPVQPTPLREDIRTSQLTPRLAEDGDHVRQYPAVLHDQPLREAKAVGSDGKAFGTNVLPEPISVSPEQARGWLQLLYGQDVADSMIGRATATGDVVSGELVRVQD